MVVMVEELCASPHVELGYLSQKDLSSADRTAWTSPSCLQKSSGCLARRRKGMLDESEIDEASMRSACPASPCGVRGVAHERLDAGEVRKAPVTTPMAVWCTTSSTRLLESPDCRTRRSHDRTEIKVWTGGEAESHCGLSSTGCAPHFLKR